MLPSYLMKKLGGREKKAQFFAKYDSFFPKNSKKVVLVVKNNTEFSGNLRVCADVLLTYKGHQVYVYKDGVMPKKLEKALTNQGIKVLKSRSWLSLYHLFTSGLMFFSHVPRDAHITMRDKRRVIVGLWHGVVFKNIESQMIFVPERKLELIKKNAKLYDLMTASSLKDKQYLAKSFMVDEDIIQVTGLPRYDLLKPNYHLDSFLNEQRKRLRKIKLQKTLILYAPTFRENNESHLDQITDLEWTNLNTILSRHNAILGVRPHPYDKKNPPFIFNSLSNLKWLGHDEFTETNLVLQYSDMLVVDFSSIWIDYLLLNRPIIGFAKDFLHYKNSERGFAYNFSDTFPDVFVEDIDSLINRIESLLHEGIPDRDYIEAKEIFHQYDLSENFSNKLEQAIQPYINDNAIQ